MNNAWQLLRMLRADPPLEAAIELRRRTFSAALEQSEQMWRASEMVTDSTRPILLFYGLVQGALALSAVRTTGDNWEFKTGHGLEYSCEEIKGGKAPTLANISVREKLWRNGDRGVQHVAKQLGSPVLAESVNLDVLASSLHEAREFHLGSDHLGALEIIVSDLENDFFPHQNTKKITVNLFPLPARIEETAPGCFSQEQVEVWLRAYPKLAELGRPRSALRRPPNPQYGDHQPGQWSVTCEWELDQVMSGVQLRDFASGVPDAWSLSPYGFLSAGISGLALPLVAGNGNPMHPLIIWWAILFAFSNLARYKPRSWTKLVNLDESRQAVPVEAILDAATRAIPQLLLAEIRSTT